MTIERCMRCAGVLIYNSEHAATGDIECEPVAGVVLNHDLIRFSTDELADEIARRLATA